MHISHGFHKATEVFLFSLVFVAVFRLIPYLWQQKKHAVLQKKHIETLGRGITDTLCKVRGHGIFR